MHSNKILQSFPFKKIKFLVEKLKLFVILGIFVNEDEETQFLQHTVIEMVPIRSMQSNCFNTVGSAFRLKSHRITTNILHFRGRSARYL